MMNTLEKAIHNIVGEYPHIRKPLAHIYQRAFSIIPGREYAINNFFSRPGYFFGFHDKNPWSHSREYHLSHHFDLNKNRKDIEKGPIKYGYFSDSKISKFFSIGESNTWNWQQGASLQWLGRSERFIVNDQYKNSAISKIHNIAGETQDIIPYHVASTDSSGTLAATYCFTKLGQGANGYGYKNYKNEDKETKITIINTLSGSVIKSIDIDEIKNINNAKSMNHSLNFFSHGLFSPEGKKLLFFHQWLEPFTKKLNTRLYSYDIENKKLFHYELSNCSHISWYGSNEIMAYCMPKEKSWGYYRATFETINWKPLAERISHSDGHPYCLHNKKIFVSDTYPDKYRMQNLYYHDIEKNQTKILLRLKIPFKYRNIFRCDFHPRLHHSGKKISFDSAHSGVRSLCILNIEE